MPLTSCWTAAPCEVGVESTIVDATGEILSILRPCSVTREDLEAVWDARLRFPRPTTFECPGQHPSHYAPRPRVVLVEHEEIVAEAELAQELGHQVGVLFPPSLPDVPVKAHAVVTVPAE
ncbi:Sua5 family C-terminal domain-containing protein [Streptomyces griseofuscus]|uniref:Sua5 family C-terminal domain-containing protein n=1 Tax=Streptomyces griseofuscus TaxID=146922 RepID=UPI00381E71BC